MSKKGEGNPKIFLDVLYVCIKELAEFPINERRKFPLWVENACFDYNMNRLETGPDSERGKSWFGNDGIDCQTMRVMPA